MLIQFINLQIIIGLHTDMLFYIVFIFVGIFLYLLSRVTRDKVFFYVLFVLVSGLAVFRYDVGYDYSNYYVLYQQSSAYIKAYLSTEPISYFLYSVLIHLGDPAFILLFYALITYLILFSVLEKYSVDPVSSLLFFVGYPLFFLQSLSLVRQFLALLIVVWGIKYIYERNLIKYVIVVVVGAMVHNSALFLLPLYFLFGAEIKPFVYFVFYLFSLLFGEMLGGLLSIVIPEYSRYLDAQVRFGTGGDKIILISNAILFFLFFLRRKCPFSVKEEFYFNSFFLGNIAFNSLQYYGHAGFRSNINFTIFLILLIPSVLKRLRPRALVESAFILCIGLIFLSSIYVSTLNQKKSAYTPYKLIFYNLGDTFK